MLYYIFEETENTIKRDIVKKGVEFHYDEVFSLYTYDDMFIGESVRKVVLHSHGKVDLTILKGICNYYNLKYNGFKKELPNRYVLLSESILDYKKEKK